MKMLIGLLVLVGIATSILVILTEQPDTYAETQACRSLIPVTTGKTPTFMCSR